MSPSLGEKISVCLLTYNHANVIDSTLGSILDQTITGYEVIVSDDCSTDGTWKRILEISRKDERIKPIRTPQNMGMPGNANFAVGHSERPYIALLHHDDLYRRDLLEKWAGILERHAGVSFVFNRYDSSAPERRGGSPFYGRQPTQNGECFDGLWFLERFLLAQWGCPVRGTAMIRRSWWDRLGGMREQFGLVADVDFWMRLSAVSQVGYVEEPLIHVRALRPDYYPEIYTMKKWNWHRKVLVYEIHADNRLNTLALNTMRGRLKWWRFRLNLSAETTKWLVYAVVRKRYEMIASGHESITQYDLWPLRVFRRILQVIIPPIGN